MLDFIDKKYTPSKDEVVCEYYIEPKGISLEEAAEHVAAESSIGTWTTVSTMSPRIAKTLKPKVFYISKATGEVKIAYPNRLFEPGNMPQILSSIAGNIFGMKMLKNLRLQDISFPKSILHSFRGPRYGIAGIRQLTRKESRPLTGTIVKPKVGLTAKMHAEVAYNAWAGGLDIVKDDENLSSMKFNKFEERVKQTLKMRELAEKHTGNKKIYMPNITAETGEMLRRAKVVRDLGGEYIMIDIMTTGWSALQTVREHVDQIIHAHRAMHAAITKNPKHGISMLVIAKIARMLGADQLHIGTAGIGKMDASEMEVEMIEDEIEDIMVKEQRKCMDGRCYHALEQDWHGIKPVLAVASGGLHPGGIPKILKRMGNNIVMQFGGGCHGHPMGTKAGAMAIRQALEASLHNIPLAKYAEAHHELKRALDKWGKS